MRIETSVKGLVNPGIRRMHLTLDQMRSFFCLTGGHESNAIPVDVDQA